MPRESIESYFIKMLATVAGRSTCARRAVGAIITDVRGHVLAMGFNGTPSGFDHCVAGERTCEGFNDPKGDTRRCLAIHAEQNSLLQCSRLDLAHTIYTSCTPCFTCAKLILNTPIARVIAAEPYAGDNLGHELLVKRHKLYYYDADLDQAVLY
jgi:dCMP deaminase